MWLLYGEQYTCNTPDIPVRNASYANFFRHCETSCFFMPKDWIVLRVLFIILFFLWSKLLKELRTQLQGPNETCTIHMTLVEFCYENSMCFSTFFVLRWWEFTTWCIYIAMFDVVFRVCISWFGCSTIRSKYHCC